MAELSERCPGTWKMPAGILDEQTNVTRQNVESPTQVRSISESCARMFKSSHLRHKGDLHTS